MFKLSTTAKLDRESSNNSGEKENGKMIAREE